MGGKLDVICFDKTGTLTEDGLDVLGARIVNSAHRFVTRKINATPGGYGLIEHRFSELLSETVAGLLRSTATANSPLFDHEKQRKIVYTMATCHSLRVVDGELLGDPLDVKMFQFTGWLYEEGGSSHASGGPTGPGFDTIAPSIAKPPATCSDIQSHSPNVSQRRTLMVFRCLTYLQVPVELGVLRNFEFVSQLRRASVVVRQFGDNGASVFVKGAPESIRDICVPESCE